MIGMDVCNLVAGGPYRPRLCSFLFWTRIGVELEGRYPGILRLFHNCLLGIVSRHIAVRIVRSVDDSLRAELASLLLRRHDVELTLSPG